MIGRLTELIINAWNKDLPFIVDSDLAFALKIVQDGRRLHVALGLPLELLVILLELIKLHQLCFNVELLLDGLLLLLMNLALGPSALLTHPEHPGIKRDEY